jgi:hypothetical protein
MDPRAKGEGRQLMKINKDKVKTILKGIGIVGINLVLGASGASEPFLLSDRAEDESSCAHEEEGSSLE